MQERSVRTPSTRTPLSTRAHCGAWTTSAKVSAAMDFSRTDRAADLLNQVIWKSVKGVDSEMPPTPHAIGSGTAGRR